MISTTPLASGRRCTHAVAVAAVTLAMASFASPVDAQIAAPATASPDRTVSNAFQDRYTVEFLINRPEAAARNYGTALKVADCILKTDATRAVDLLGGEATTDPKFERLRRATTTRYQGCAQGAGGRAVPMLLSGAIAEALLKREAAKHDARAMTVHMNDAIAFHGEMGGPATIEKVGRCLAVYSPGLVDALLQTAVASSEESAALNKLYASTPECMIGKPPQKIPSAFQRAAMAQGLFQWTHRGT